jgi:hypothetical protein
MKRLTVQQLNTDVLGWIAPTQQVSPARDRVMGILRARSGATQRQPSSQQPLGSLPELEEQPSVKRAPIPGTPKPYQANYPFLKR